MTISRRQLLLGSAGLAATACSSSRSATSDTTADANAEPSSTTAAAPAEVPETTTSVEPLPMLVEAPEYQGLPPFALGVASGDPDANSVVLWTRLITSHTATEFIAEGDVSLVVDIAVDESFDELIRSTVVAAPFEYGHSVHAIIDELDPDTWHYYRFRLGTHTSPVGRTRTTPAAGQANPPNLRFGFSSCQNWESGEYGAHRNLANEDLDLFVWLGDYIYEYGPGNAGDVNSLGRRVHNSPEVQTLDDYRARYALYKSDPSLQAHHAAHPWVVTWDDHEVDNNYAGTATEDGQSLDIITSRRAAAYQAWWENMPVRIAPPQETSDFVIYRSIRWGDVADLHMLDGRQFRAPQPTDGEPVVLPGLGDLGVRQLSNTARDPLHSMLGPVQRQWLEDQVTSSAATWNILGNQVYMHGLNAFPGEVPSINIDTWDGYFGEREALLEVIGGPDQNLVILSGDFHSSTAADVRADPFDQSGPIMATEFMAPAISSTFPEQLRALAPLILGVNPQIRNFSPENGYMTCEVSDEVWTTRLHVLADVADGETSAGVEATFEVKQGQAGIAARN